MVYLTGKQKKEMPEEKQEEVQISENEYTKEQILAASRYQGRRDLIEALLDDRKKYTMETVDRMVEDFMKRMVK